MIKTIISLIVSALFGLMSASITLLFIKKHTRNNEIIEKKKLMGVSLLGSLLISGPIVILVLVILSLTKSKPMVGSGLMLFGVTGSIVLLKTHLKENLLQQKYNKLFQGPFILFLIMIFIGFKFKYFS